LTFNVNYYSASQASLFWLYGIVGHRCRGNSRWDRLVLAFLFTSSLWGSSRGALLALGGAGLAFLLIIVVCGQGRRAKRAGILLATVVVASLVGFLVFYDQIYDIFRLAKGLNMRDRIWSRGFELWQQRPLLGWGLDVNVAKRFEAGPLPEGKSLHSGYLYTLVRGGLALFVFSYGLLVSALIWGLGRRRELWLRYRWAAGAVIFYLINAAFRTFSLGGLGLLPVLAAVGLSLCLHARVREGV
jgi:O-antigen ligase